MSWRGRVLVLRERARAAPPLALAPGMSALWDRRFAVHLTATASRPVTIRQLGAAGVAALREDRIVLDNSLPRLIYPTLPAIWDEHGLASVPHLFYQRILCFGGGRNATAALTSWWRC